MCRPLDRRSADSRDARQSRAARHAEFDVVRVLRPGAEASVQQLFEELAPEAVALGAQHPARGRGGAPADAVHADPVYRDARPAGALGGDHAEHQPAVAHDAAQELRQVRRVRRFGPRVEGGHRGGALGGRRDRAAADGRARRDRRAVPQRVQHERDERARGREAAQRVTAVADRTYEETLSAAKRDALIIEGEADAERTRILADAFGADPEFFDFYRSLAAYETSILGGNSTLVIPPDHEFLTYMKSATPRVSE